MQLSDLLLLASVLVRPRLCDAVLVSLFRCVGVMRIAKGCGCFPQEVVQLLDEHKRFSKMVGKMGKLGKGK